MEDILSLIVVFLFYLVGAAAKSKKKRKKQSRSFGGAQKSFTEMNKPQSGKEKEEMILNGIEETLRQAEQMFDNTSETAHKLQNRKAVQEDESCHDTKRLHLHEVSAGQMEDAGEGEDPCHAGSAAEDLNKWEPESVASEEELRRKMAQDILRGVIVSEIIERPCMRRNVRNGR